MATVAERGRQAERPSQILRAGWRDILVRTWPEIGNDHLSLIAAGVGFYALLALFPGIAATVATWGLAFDPQQIEQQIATISQLLPEQAAAIVTRAAGMDGRCRLSGRIFTCTRQSPGRESIGPRLFGLRSR